MARFIAVVSGDSMWPSYNDGDRLLCDDQSESTVIIGSVVVFKHPFKTLHLVKRVTSIEGSEVFVEGDNPDPTSSEDSHNFGKIPTSSVLGIVIEKSNDV